MSKVAMLKLHTLLQTIAGFELMKMRTTRTILFNLEKLKTKVNFFIV